MKQKLLAFALLIITVFALFSPASAAVDPIVCTMEVAPSSLSEPGDVTITITISNSGDTDMNKPLTLFDPTSQVVKDFGDNGSVTLKAGEVKTWTGTWNVNQRTLENGQIVFFAKYTIVDDKGVTKSQSQPIRGEITKSNFTSKVSVTRTITPETAREGQAVNVIYDIANEGTVSVMNLTLTENKDILASPVTIAAELKAGESAQVKLPVVMGKKDLTSEGTLTYTIADGTQVQTYKIDPQVILFGETNILATLSSQSKGVMMNGTIKLTLAIKNTGDFDYTDVRVHDATLGDVFTNQTVPAGETLTLDKEITLTQTTDFQFEIFATDNSGVESSFLSNILNLVAVDPDQALLLNLSLTSNKTEVYSTTDVVRFTVTITNNSTVDASNVAVYQANTPITTFASIPAGTSRTFTREVTLNMAGKYQFRAEAKDALDNTLAFTSNGLQIAFLTPTPAPVTPDPNITPTPEPTFVKATYPRISDPGIGTLPKLIRTFFYPLMIAGFGLLVVALVILFIATGKRAKLRKASENALDHLERSSHRDYVAPADTATEHTADPSAAPEEEQGAGAQTNDTVLTDEELPHMKYVRNAYQHANMANPEDMPSEPTSSESETSKDDLAWNTDPQKDRYDEENPYRRRTGRVSPYARQTADVSSESTLNQDEHRDESK